MRSQKCPFSSRQERRKIFLSTLAFPCRFYLSTLNRPKMMKATGTWDWACVKAQKGKNGQNALFHLLQNAPTPALIYHDFLPTSTHAHNYITRSLDSLHPNEQVYMHFNIKKVEKVVLRRKKAKMGKTHCFTCFKMRLHLR